VNRCIWILLAATALWAQTGAEKQKAAIAQQRQSIRKQAENLGLWLPPKFDDSPAPLAAAPDPACDALPETEISPIVDDAAKTHSVDRRLLLAVIQQESAFRPCAISPKGAKGLMQLMPDTAADLGVNDPFDAKESITAGAKYLKQFLDKYKGNLSQALAAYNAGPATVDTAAGIPDIPETKDYVKSILDRLAK
jgi:soluble lytic murein transglycosylase-like protein